MPLTGSGFPVTILDGCPSIADHLFDVENLRIRPNAVRSCLFQSVKAVATLDIK
jgi:hypothetical protein